MIVPGLILVLILGISIINKISSEFSLLEKIGAGYLVGIASVTIMMFILELISIRFTGDLLLVIMFILIMVINYKVFLKFRFYIEKIKTKCQLPKVDFKKISFVWIIFMLLTVIIVYGSVRKSLFWPTFAYDNVTGYDLMGKVMGNEGEINNSLFEINKEPIKGSHTRIIYPILVSGSFAFAYLFGLETSKIMTSLFLVAFVIVYYGLLKKISSPTTAIIFTFLMIITPEMYAFTSLSTTNIPFAIYTSIGYLYLYLWLAEGKYGNLLLAAIFLALCCWTRSEGIFFLFAGSLVLLYSTIRNKTWKEFLIFIFPGLLLFFTWNLYVKFNFNIEQNVFQSSLFWDAEKISIILNWVINLITNTQLYGISFYILVIIILLNLKFIMHKDKSTYLLSLLLLSFFLYILLFYQLDNANLDPIEIMMKTSYRRGLFVFIPMIWFYVSTAKITDNLINKVKSI